MVCINSTKNDSSLNIFQGELCWRIHRGHSVERMPQTSQQTIQRFDHQSEMPKPHLKYQATLMILRAFSTV